MKVLYIAAHLGGGVGKAHAAIAGAMPLPVRERFLLLEAPRDRRYAELIAQQGKTVVVAAGLEDIAAHCEWADIVQFEFWNHPKLFECLARSRFPAMRSVFWSHVSGLFKPVIQPGFLDAADRFVFTSPASLELEAVRTRMSQGQDKFAVIGSAFGFQEERPQEQESRQTDAQLCYLGTVDFIKMHPGFFEVVDQLSDSGIKAAVWGSFDSQGAVVAARGAMKNSGRVRLMGQTEDPRAAMLQSKIFFYPLQPDHYGTAENALIEAMSLGLVPVVLANPAECAIVRQGQTGFIASSIDDCIAILDMLLSSPERLERVSRAARDEAQQAYVPERSARKFVDLWTELAVGNKHLHDFVQVTGLTPRDWYRATQRISGDDKDFAAEMESDALSKGTLAHFRSAFPDDRCWLDA